MKKIAAMMVAGVALMAGPAFAGENPPTENASTENPFEKMYGEWVGPASGVGPDRQPFSLTQTERAGPMLGGAVTVVEGRGYDADGAVSFNAFAVISKAMSGDGYEIRSYLDGRSGTFPLTVTDTGYVWQIPAGPGAIVRYTAVIEGDTWTETGEYVREGMDPVQTFQMTVTRIGDTDWPAAGMVMPEDAE